MIRASALVAVLSLPAHAQLAAPFEAPLGAIREAALPEAAKIGRQASLAPQIDLAAVRAASLAVESDRQAGVFANLHLRAQWAVRFRRNDPLLRFHAQAAARDAQALAMAYDANAREAARLALAATKEAEAAAAADRLLAAARGAFAASQRLALQTRLMRLDFQLAGLAYEALAAERGAAASLLGAQALGNWSLQLSAKTR